jgi:hypothetical protein
MAEASYTLKAGNDKWSMVIHDPENTTLAYVREKAEQANFLKREDQFLNKDGAPVSDEGYAVSNFAVGTTINVQRFVVQAPARPAKPAPDVYIVNVQRTPEEAESVKIPATTLLIELRGKLSFMKDEYYFTNGTIRVTDEKKFKVLDLAKDGGTIQVGPKPAAAPKPAGDKPLTLSATDVTSVKARESTITAQVETQADLLEGHKWTDNASSVPTSVQYYDTADIAAKKALFNKLHLDQGLVVKGADSVSLAEESSKAPAWYVPSGEGPGVSSPGSSRTHRMWAAATKVLSEIRKHGIDQVAASGSWNDLTGANGVQVKASYLSDLEEYGKSVRTELYILEEKAVRKTILTLSNQDLRPKAQFRYDVAKIVNSSESRIRQYQRLHEEIFADYGHFFPTQVVLGGSWTKEYMERSSNTAEQARWIQEIKAAAEGGGTSQAGSFKAGLASGNYRDSFTSFQVMKQEREQTARSVGGAVGVDGANDSAWETSLASMDHWAVIERTRMLPIISLLEGDEEADQLRRQCISLINEFATDSISEKTALDMESYVALLHATEAEKLSLI